MAANNGMSQTGSGPHPAALRFERRRSPVALALLFLGLLALYLRTAPPSLVTGDSGELITAAAVLGVPHPTGYPTYILLSHALLRWLPIGHAASRVAWLSAAAGAGAAVLLASILRYLSAPLPLAVWGGLVTGLSPHFWDQANAPEVYALNLFLQLIVWHLLLVPLPRHPQRRWALVMFALGISLTHHGTAWLNLPAIAVHAAWTARNRESRLWVLRGLPFLALGLGIFVALPVRARLGPYVNWGQPGQILPFLRHISGGQFQGMMLQSIETATAARGPLAWSLLARHFGWPVFLALPLLLAAGRREKPAIKVFLFLVMAMSAGFAFSYGIPDIEPFFTPALAALTIAVTVDAARVLRTSPAPRQRRRIFLAAIGAGLIVNVTVNYWPADRSRHVLAVDYAKSLLDIPTGPASIASSGWTAPFAMMYFLRVEHYRGDVIVATPLLRQLPAPALLTEYHTVYPNVGASSGESVEQHWLLFAHGPSSSGSAARRTAAATRPIRGENDPLLHLSALDRALLADIAVKRTIAADRAGDPATALAHFRKALAVGRNNAKLLNNVGNAHFRAGRFNDALHRLRQAQRIAPRLTEALLNEGNVLMALGRSPEAVERFQQYLAAEREAPLPLVNLADALFAVGNYREAVRHYRRAAELAPGQPAILNRLGLAETRNGDPGTAIRTFLLAQCMEPRTAEQLVNLGVAFAAAGQLAAAESSYREALQFAPSSPGIMNNLANVLVRQRRCAEARQCMAQAIAIRRDPIYMNNLAGLLIECGDPAAAIPILKALLTDRPALAEAQRNLDLARSALAAPGAGH